MHNKTVFLHIGPPKTASTAIQKLLSNSANTLLKNGVLYPAAGRLLNGESFPVKKSGVVSLEKGPCIHHQFLAWTLQSRVTGLEADVCWKALRQELSATSAHSIIISGEAFFHMDKENIEHVHSFLKDYNVKIVFYLRHPYKRAKSVYAQSIKVGKCNGSFNNFLRNYYCEQAKDQLEALTGWGEFFGDENMIVKPFERLAKENCLSLDFLTTIGLSEQKIPIDTNNKTNTGISNAVLYCTRLVNRVEFALGKTAFMAPLFSRIRFLIRSQERGRNLSERIWKKRKRQLYPDEDRKLFNHCIREWYPQIVSKYVEETDKPLYKL